MNNIHEDDWADDSWSRHSGMFVRETSDSNSDEKDKSNETFISANQQSDDL